MRAKPKTIDEYLAGLSPDKRAALEKLRKTIRAIAPQAEECISYQIAAFRQEGMLVGFGATLNHCAFYLMSAATVAAHKDELKDYDTSKGTIRSSGQAPASCPGAEAGEGADRGECRATSKIKVARRAPASHQGL
jgi:uncharacterized protein YdhG (YjbR/CyaY superfamily)